MGMQWAGRLLGGIGREIKELTPSTWAGKAMTFGPDLAFAAMAAGAAPKGTDLLTRGLIGATDFGVFGLLPSYAGRFAGQKIGRAFGLEGEALGGVQNAAEMAAQMAPAFLGIQNPVLNAEFEKQAKSQEELAKKQQEMRDHHIEEQLINALLGSGYSAGSTIMSARSPLSIPTAALLG